MKYSLWNQINLLNFFFFPITFFQEIMSYDRNTNPTNFGIPKKVGTLFYSKTLSYGL